MKWQPSKICRIQGRLKKIIQPSFLSMNKCLIIDQNKRKYSIVLHMYLYQVEKSMDNEKIFEKLNRNSLYEKKVLLVNNKMKRSEYKQICDRQFAYFLEKPDCKEAIFEKRCSYRNNMKTLSNSEVEQLIRKICHTRDYRPTPIPGNLNFLKVAILGDGKCRYFNLDENVLKEFEGESDDFTHYLQSLTIRTDIQGTGGTFFFPMVNFELIERKYRSMAEPLAFITLGCLLQNLTLLFDKFNISSCIHYGVTEYKEWNINDDVYRIPCMLRAGYAEGK